MRTDLSRRLVSVAALAWLGACGGDAPPPPEETATPDLPVLSTPTVAEPRTVLDIFPEDPARDLLMANCTSCHAVACAAMGQRPSGRWAGLQESHAEHVASMPEEELETVFTYLRSNFSDAQPEPTIPAAFLEGGCTPF